MLGDTIRFIPRPYQAFALEFMLDNPKAGVLLDVGLGKSVVAATAANTITSMGECPRWLIVAPLRVCQTTWVSEFNKWEHLSKLTVLRLHDTPAPKRVQALQNLTADITVINVELLPWLIKELAPSWPFRGVILDESSKFKNHQTARFKAFKRMLPKIDYLYELTASPVAQGLTTLWPQMYLLDGGERLGRTLTAFRAKWFDSSSYQSFVYTPKVGAKEEIEDAIKDICLTLRSVDHLDLPDVIENVIGIDIGDDARKQYKDLERHNILDLDGEEITAVSAGVLSGKLSQLANGILYKEDGGWHEFHNAKVEALLEFFEQRQGSPFLLAYHFKADKERIQTALGEQGLEFFDGTEKQMKRWQKGSIPAMALHPESAGHGVDGLQHASNCVLWMSPPSSREQYDQLNGRVVGARQLGTRFAAQSGMIHMIKAVGTVDELRLATLNKRGAEQESFLNALRRYIADYQKSL